MPIQCPDCDRDLHGKIICACGWTAPLDDADFIDPFDSVNDAPAPEPVYVEPKPRGGESYRARWFRENRKEYYDCKPFHCPPFYCVGRINGR